MQSYLKKISVPLRPHFPRLERLQCRQSGRRPGRGPDRRGGSGDTAAES